MYNLRAISCDSNKLKTLDLLSLPNVELLIANDNEFDSLDINGLTKIYNLYVQNNINLTHLYLKNGSQLNTLYTNFANCPNLKYICTDEYNIKKNQDLINQFAYKCQVNSYCSFVPGGDFYNINGTAKYDENSNGCDATDITLSNLKFAISNDTNKGVVLANDLGYYSIDVLAGTHVISPVLEKPDYFTITPSSVNATFPSQLNSINQIFCVISNGIHPDLEITLLPIEVSIPGFNSTFKIIYKNKGNIIQSGSINFKFNDGILDFVSSDEPFSNIQTGDITWSFNDLKPFETKDITFILKTNRPTDVPAINNGDILKLTATIASQGTDETPIDNTFTLNQTVVGSYDPNDKTCLEGSIITPSLIGEYIHYMIRFENLSLIHI